jgi:hypothetical protein
MMNNAEFEVDLEEDYIEQTRKAVKKRKDVLSFLPTVGMIILLFAVSSISSLLQFSFSFQEVVWSSLIITLGLRMAMLLSGQWIGADGRYQVDQKSEDVKKAKSEYMEASEKLDIPTFDRWIYRENIRRKTEAYQTKNNRKIAALDIKINRIKRKMMFTPTEKLRAKMHRLSQKKENIEAVNSDDFVRQHILDLRVKYKPLHASDFLTPSEFLSGKTEKYHMSEAAENVAEIAKFLPMTIFVTLWFSIVGTSYYFGSLSVVSVVMDTFATALHVSTGWYYVGRRTVSTEIFIFRSRKAMIERHLSEVAPDKAIKETQENDEPKEEKAE